MAANLHNAFHWWIMLPWNVWLDSTNKLMQIFAVLAGAVGAYWKFGISMKLAVSGRSFKREETKYLIARVRLESTAVFKMYPSQKGSGLVFSVLDRQTSSGKSLEGVEPKWRTLGAVPVFEKQTWINPSETLEDIVVLTFPSDTSMVHLRIRVVVNARYVRRTVAWEAAAVVMLL